MTLLDRLDAGAPLVHPTAIVAGDATVGAQTEIRANAHIGAGAEIGDGCTVGENTYVAAGVRIGPLSRLDALVFVGSGVTIERGVLVGAGTVFATDRFPRATDPELCEPRALARELPIATLVREGATIGANCTIGTELIVGRFAMVGIGSIVSRSVPDFHLVIGQPATTIGYVCRCGQLMHRIHQARRAYAARLTCCRCNRRYRVADGAVVEEG